MMLLAAMIMTFSPSPRHPSHLTDRAPPYSAGGLSGVQLESKLEGLESGDIALRCRRGIWSALIRDVSQKERRFSHAGLVLREKDRLFVIHAVADDFSIKGAVVCEPVSDFLEGAGEFAFYRMAARENLRRGIATEAVSRLGRPFDSRFDLGDETEIYCTELVRICVNRAFGREIIKAKKSGSRLVVPLDACYLHPWAIKVLDSKSPDG